MIVPAHPRPSRRLLLELWVIGALVPLALLWLADVGKYDFSALWIAGQQVINGDASSVYNEAVAQQYADRFTRGIGKEFPYPPHALFFFVPFAVLPYLPGYIVWNIASAIFFWWAARPYIPKGIPSIVSVLTPAALLCIDFGQTGLLAGGLWLLAFRGKWPAVALLTFKPHIGMLSVLSIRGPSSFLRIVALVIGLIAASITIFGLAAWAGFVDRAFLHAELVAGGGRWRHASVSPAVGFGFWGWIPYAAGGAILLARRVNVFTAATATFLIAPFGFHYDMPVACLGLGLLLVTRWTEMPFWHRLPIGMGFISPVIAVVGVWFVPPLLFWALWAQVKYDTGTFDGRPSFEWLRPVMARLGARPAPSSQRFAPESGNE
ncbi:MAG TPA: glycosyltransferase family 87 protein [Sphingomicrobium sp.]|nr:glycosyltransferase family 87 protein [Sphingomicrobium sp.]